LRHEVILTVREETPGWIVDKGEHVHLLNLPSFMKYSMISSTIRAKIVMRLLHRYRSKMHNATIGVIGRDNSLKSWLSVVDMEKILLSEKIQRISRRGGLKWRYAVIMAARNSWESCRGWIGNMLPRWVERSRVAVEETPFHVKEVRMLCRVTISVSCRGL